MDIREKHVSWTHITWENLPPPSSWDTSWGGDSIWAAALWEQTRSETLHPRLSPTWSRMSCALLQGENTPPLRCLEGRYAPFLLFHTWQVSPKPQVRLRGPPMEAARQSRGAHSGGPPCDTAPAGSVRGSPRQGLEVILKTRDKASLS